MEMKSAPKMNTLSKTEPDTKTHKWDPRPHLNFTEAELPAIKDWEVGEKYTLIVEVEQCAKHKRPEGFSAEFKVLKVGAHK